MSMFVLLMTRTAVSHNLGIPAFEGNSSSCAHADGNKNMSSVLTS